MKPQANQVDSTRRSTRVQLDSAIQVEGGTGIMQGTTVVVNLHGALIRTLLPIQRGSQIRLTVASTGESSTARVVYVAERSPLTCGLELDHPQNIWGIAQTPPDWEFGHARHR